MTHSQTWTKARCRRVLQDQRIDKQKSKEVFWSGIREWHGNQYKEAGYPDVLKWADESLEVMQAMEKEMGLATIDGAEAAKVVFNIHEMDLNKWLDRVESATTQDEVFAILKEFKPLGWTDHQRAEMSQFYIPKLEEIHKNNPNKWTVDGQPATPKEAVQAEKAVAGFYNDAPVKKRSLFDALREEN